MFFLSEVITVFSYDRLSREELSGSEVSAELSCFLGTNCLSHFSGARNDKGTQALNVARYYIDNNIVLGLLILVFCLIRYCVMQGVSGIISCRWDHCINALKPDLVALYIGGSS